jgi:CBS domain containing-hemolysin-like protein
VQWDGLRFQVVDVDGPRIERLEVEFLPDEEAEKVEAAAE